MYGKEGDQHNVKHHMKELPARIQEQFNAVSCNACSSQSSIIGTMSGLSSYSRIMTLKLKKKQLSERHLLEREQEFLKRKVEMKDLDDQIHMEELKEELQEKGMFTDIKATTSTTTPVMFDATLDATSDSLISMTASLLATSECLVTAKAPSMATTASL